MKNSFRQLGVSQESVILFRLHKNSSFQLMFLFCQQVMKMESATWKLQIQMGNFNTHYITKFLENEIQRPKVLLNKYKNSSTQLHLNIFQGILYVINLTIKYINFQDLFKLIKLKSKFNCSQSTSFFEYFDFLTKFIKGTKLKNTQWVIGCIIYAGDDSKLCQNQGTPRYKASHIEYKLNIIIVMVLFLQAIMCLVMAILAGLFLVKTQKKENSTENNESDEKHYSYIYESNSYQSPEVIGVITYFSFFLLFNTMVPISLIISLETLKWLQTQLMEYDEHMSNLENQEQFRVLNTLIHEELGRVEYVFTDKTGTLTSNLMIFRGCCIRGIQYTSEDIKDIFLNQQDGVSQKQSIFDEPDLRDFIDFWLCVTICHDVIIDEICSKPNKIIYQGSSPDEVCLVETASLKYDFTFLKRTSTSIVIKVENKILVYDILAKIEFTSERKRMSVIVKDIENDKIIIYTKGADNIILSRLDNSQNVEQQINLVKFSLKKFSQEGLRTLCLAYKILDEVFFQSWSQKYKALQMDLLKGIKTAQSLIKLHEDLLEQNLLLLGSTALEDRLQEGVPETISDLHRAGIKVWMLTGDKLETAQNIAYLCNLLDKRTKSFRVQGQSTTEIMERFSRIKKKIQISKTLRYSNKQRREDSLLQLQLIFLRDQSSVNSHVRSIQKRISRNISMKSSSVQKSNISDDRRGGNSSEKEQYYTSYALVIEGESISHIFNSKEASNEFLSIIPECRSVICCRSTPNQKAEVVSFVKKNIKAVTLAIGDGGNDVNMIQEADIGVGILGREGNQAAAGSDYYFSQFRYLWRLLFIHGRWNFFRTAYFVNFFFFKNLLFTFQQFYFAFHSGFSGQTFWEDGYLLNYNSIVTGVAPLYYGTFDQDLQPDKSEYVMKSMPKVYSQFRKLNLFSYFQFAKWFTGGAACSGLIFYWSKEAYNIPIIKETGMTDGLWQLSINCYWSSVVATYIVLILDSNICSVITFFGYGIFGWFLFFPVFVYLWDMVNTPLQNMQQDILSNIKFFLVVMWNGAIIGGSKYLYSFWQQNEYPTMVDKVKRGERQWLKQQKEKQLNKEEEEKLNLELIEDKIAQFQNQVPLEFNQVILEEKVQKNEIQIESIAAENQKNNQELVESEEKVEQIKIITCHSNVTHFKTKKS